MLRINDQAPNFILPTVSEEEAKQKYPGGWKAPGPICGLFPSRGRYPIGEAAHNGKTTER
jgi:hypothetical protein